MQGVCSYCDGDGYRLASASSPESAGAPGQVPAHTGADRSAPEPMQREPVADSRSIRTRPSGLSDLG